MYIDLFKRWLSYHLDADAILNSNTCILLSIQLSSVDSDDRHVAYSMFSISNIIPNNQWMKGNDGWIDVNIIWGAGRGCRN